MSRPQSLQRSLSRNLTIGPILLGAILLLTSVLTYRAVLNTIAAELIDRGIAQMNAAFIEYLHPVQEIVELSKAFGLAGKFDGQPPEQLDLVFGPLIATVTQVSSVHLARASGDEYMLMQRDDGSFYNRLTRGAEPGWIVAREWTGNPVPAGNASRERVASDYSPLQRPWFQKAMAAFEASATTGGAERLVWSEPYTFFTSREPGITASVAYRTPSGSVEVLGFDILLKDIQAFAERIELRESGAVFVMLRAEAAQDLMVLAVPRNLPASSSGASAAPLPRPISTLTGPAGTLVTRLFGAGVPDNSEPLRFSAAGEIWWGAVARSSIATDKEVWIAAIITERALLQGIPDLSLITLLAVLATVAVMVLRARRLAARYGDPIAELVTQTERMARLNFSRPTTIESPIYEVQTLAASQDAMRRSLGALTAMNDRAAIARELKTLPEERREGRAGDWQVSICDSPLGTVDGIYAMCWPVVKNASQAW
ncbi:MAG: cache domain-containing protein, partial [Gammaproteobacteria bacterium]|nr:cache domain-containing protein [Gammaproteobacteria bacterium]